MASDTTPSAHNVAGNMDAEQDDCKMNVTSLVMGYASGWKENTKTVEKTNEYGKKMKVQYIVTAGGAFLDGTRLIRVGRKLLNVFGSSSQRKERLVKDSVAMDLPQVGLIIFT